MDRSTASSGTAAVIAEQLRANDTYQTVLTARLLRIAASEVMSVRSSREPSPR